MSFRKVDGQESYGKFQNILRNSQENKQLE